MEQKKKARRRWMVLAMVGCLCGQPMMAQSYGDGEYARVLCTMSEIKYTIIIQYKPGTKDGRWQYVDSRKFSEYTHTILNLFKKNEDSREKRSLDALMEL